MPGTYTPSAKLSAGDPAMPDGPASNAAPAREVLDNRRHLRGSTWGQLVWNGRLDVSGTAASPVVKVGVIEAITLCDGNGTSTGTWRPYFTASESTLGASHVEGGGSLANSTHYYVYAYNDGTTTVAWQISTTPPTDSGAPSVLLQWKRSETANYRFLGSFVTDASGNPIKAYTTRGRRVYLEAVPGGVSIADTGTSGYEALSLAALVPPHARVAVVDITLTGTATFRSVGDSGGMGGSVTGYPIVLNTSREIEWNEGVSGGTISVSVRGIEE